VRVARISNRVVRVLRIGEGHRRCVRAGHAVLGIRQRGPDLRGVGAAAREAHSIAPAQGRVFRPARRTRAGVGPQDRPGRHIDAPGERRDGGALRSQMRPA
jgi:hypothetical protein